MKYLICLFLLFQLSLSYTQEYQVVESIEFGDYLSPLMKIKKSGKTYYYHPASDFWIDDVEEHAADLFVVVKDGKYGMLREDGKVLLPCVYDHIKLETRYEGQWEEGIAYDYKFAVLKRKGSVGVADEQGNIIVPFDYEDAKVINKAVIAVSRKGVWGWVSAQTGQLLQEPQFEYVTNFYSDDFVEIRNGEQAGLAKATGDVIIPIKYDDYMRILYDGEEVRFEANISTCSYVFDTTGNVLISGHELYRAIEGSSLLVFKEKDYLGIIDPVSKKVIVPASLEYIGGFNRNLARAKKKGQYGVIGAQGEIVLDFEYDEVSFLKADGRYTDESVPTISLGGRASAYDRDPRWKARMDYESEVHKMPYLIAAMNDGQKGIYNWEGHPILPMGKYSGIDAHYYNGKTFYRVENQGKIGVADELGEEILPLDYVVENSYQFSNRGVEYQPQVLKRYLAFSKGKREGSYLEQIGLFDLETKKLILPIAEQYIDILNEEWMLVRKRLENYDNAFYSYNIKQNRMDSLLQQIAECHLVDNRYWLLEMQNKEYKLVDLQGRLIYKNPTWRTDAGYNLLRFPTYNDKNHGGFYSGLKKIYGEEGNLFINDRGEEKRFEGIEQVDAFYEGVALAAKRDVGREGERRKYKYGMIDVAGRVVLPFEYDNVYATGSEDGILQIQKGMHYGLARRDGLILLEPIFDYVELSASYPNIMLTQDGKSGMADKNGNRVVPAIYDDIRRNYHGKDKTWPIIVKKDGWYYVMDKDGNKAPIKAKEKE
ncbi:hypothetical protein M472_02645 [Sphingobacterium paucimobilis HER1398]|uniref:WG repeat-containing protein n=2 Tax=Sphingobacterium TaxID=28453 RepID=U2J4T0_9SPHI|nr:hypothetical protein M472_02645 [Sphingobacterium paucimobilis HER1398]